MVRSQNITIKTPGFIFIAVLFILFVFISACEESYNAVDPKTLDKWETYNTNNVLVSDSILSVAEDSKGNLWFGTRSNGVIKYDGKIWSNYTENIGLVNNNYIQAIEEDRFGNIWFGTAYGMSKYNGSEFLNYFASDTSLFDISDITEDRLGNIWVGTYGLGLYIGDENSFERRTFNDSLLDVINVIVEDLEGNIWLCIKI